MDPFGLWQCRGGGVKGKVRGAAVVSSSSSSQQLCRLQVLTFKNIQHFVVQKVFVSVVQEAFRCSDSWLRSRFVRICGSGVCCDVGIRGSA